MTQIPDRQEFHRFAEEKTFVLSGRQLNVLWRVATILAAGEMFRLNSDERRDLGQCMQATMHDAVIQGQIDYLNEDPKPFTPATLRAFGRAVEELRHELLYGVDENGADKFAEQHMMLALSTLEQAQRYLSVAALNQESKTV